MTQPDPPPDATQPQLSFAIAITRIEGKVDSLGKQMEAGDKASGQLVELVKTELNAVQEGVKRLEHNQREIQAQNDKAISVVRTSVEGQLAAVHVDIKGATDDLYKRVNHTDKMVNRLIGGTVLGGAMGISGLVALVRGLSGH